MRATTFTILLLLNTIFLFGQKELTYWFIGKEFGIKYENGGRTVIPPRLDNNPTFFYGGNACMSDKKTGEFLFQATGAYVLDKNYKPMPGGTKSLKATFGTIGTTYIVPLPVDENRYLIFYTDAGTTQIDLFYAEVDMRLRGGLGDVVFFDKKLRTNVATEFAIVKDKDKLGGYWVITHTNGNNEYQTFRIGYDGKPQNMVSSFVGKATPINQEFVLKGNMTTNKKGDLIAYTYATPTGLPEQYNPILGKPEIRIELLNFDKCTGKITLKETLPSSSSITSINAFQASVVFSKNDLYLYLSTVNYNPTNLFTPVFHEIWRFDMKAAAITNSKTLIAQIDLDNNYTNRKIALAPDGNILVVNAKLINYNTRNQYIGELTETESATPKFNFNAFPAISDSLNQLNFGWYYQMPTYMKDTVKFNPPTNNIIAANCWGDSVTFITKDFSLYTSYSWDLGDGTTSKELNFKHWYKNEGKYLVRFDWGLCGGYSSYTDTLVLFKPLEVDLGTDTLLCAGEKYELKTKKGADSYTWSTGETTNSIIIDKAATYWVKLIKGKCESHDTVKIAYNPSVWVDLGEKFYLCEDDGQTVKLDAGKGFSEYLWTPTGDTTQWIIVRKAGDYYVIVKDFRGCPGEDGAVIERRCDLYAFIPNAFTPDGDGLNDVFSPSTREVEDYEFTVINRWGQVVFKSNDPQKGWDGNYLDKAAPAGVYFYTLSYKGFLSFVPRSISQSGTFHLLR